MIAQHGAEGGVLGAGLKKLLSRVATARFLQTLFRAGFAGKNRQLTTENTEGTEKGPKIFQGLFLTPHCRASRQYVR